MTNIKITDVFPFFCAEPSKCSQAARVNLDTQFLFKIFDLYLDFITFTVE